MMRRPKNQTETDSQAQPLTEGLYEGICTVQVTDPFFGYVLATSTAVLQVELVQKMNMVGQFKARIIINNCTYSPEKLSYLFPTININTTAELVVDESMEEVALTGVIPFLSNEEKSGTLSLTQEADGFISTQSTLATFSIFAKVKKQAVNLDFDLFYKLDQ